MGSWQVQAIVLAKLDTPNLLPNQGGEMRRAACTHHRDGPILLEPYRRYDNQNVEMAGMLVSRRRLQ